MRKARCRSIPSITPTISACRWAAAWWGVEITDDATELPRFRHPHRAAYVFGAERYSLSPRMLGLCEFVVKIPTRFSINVGMAGAIVLYDRLMSQSGYARPVTPSGGDPVPPPHSWGAPLARPRGY